jgi:Ca2+-transporting ATPase
LSSIPNTRHFNKKSPHNAEKVNRIIEERQVENSPVRVKAVHTAVRGRVRLEVLGLYRNAHIKHRLEFKLIAGTGIRSVKANTLTGRVLIIFDAQSQTLDTLAAKIQSELAELAVTPARKKVRSPKRISLLHKLISTARRVNKLHNLNLQRKVTESKLAETRRQIQPWHTQPDAEVLTALQVNALSGLSSIEAATRLEQYGANRLVTATGRSSLSILLEQFTTLPVTMLGIAAVISIMTGGLLDAAVIMSVVMINAVIGFITEWHSEKTIIELTRTAPRITKVMRDSRVYEIPIEEVVPGDVLLFSPGSYVAADVRLIASQRLTLDESSLTGESMPVVKRAGEPCNGDTPLGERKNMTFMGTMVTGGSGKGVVVATAEETQLGQIQALASAARPTETAMQRQLERMGTQLGVLSGAVCLGIFGVGLWRGLGWLNMLKSSVSLAVSAIPEGLPAVATTTLALGIRNMRKHNVAIRRLEAVETLGSVQTFCMDKTGTLTQNRMTAVALFVGGRRIEIDEGFFKDIDSGNIIAPLEFEELRRLLQVVVVCSEAELKGPDEYNKINGSPTENALVELAIRAGLNAYTLRREYPRIEIRHRAEDRPYMLTLHGSAANGHFVAVKGSPAYILSLCNRQLIDDELRPLQEAHRRHILEQNEAMAGEALRVLGMAYGDTQLREGEPSDLVWLGLAGMLDPLRSGMVTLIRQFHQAGIGTVMITGDQSATAYAVGRRLDLSAGGPLKILDSPRLEELGDEALSALTEDLHVFARVSPKHKLQIVQAMQKAGKVVAMTGDGINDGPALKAANIGVAMGVSGTDAARSVADVVLEDDNLHTMITAIEQGRTIYGNIRKTLHFLVATNLTEIEIMLTGIALGLGELLNPMQLLWINLISDIFPGLALSIEPAEPSIIRRPPRDPDEPIIHSQDLQRMGIESTVLALSGLVAYTYARKKYGAGTKANTVAFSTLTTGELLHTISCRSATHTLFNDVKRPANRYLNLALGGSLAAQLLTVIVPGLRRLLGNAPLSFTDLLVVGASSIASLLANETLKTAAIKSPMTNQSTSPAPASSQEDRL